MRLWVSENPCKRERERQREAHKRGIERGVSCKGWVYSSSFLVFLSCPSLSSFISHPSSSSTVGACRAGDARACNGEVAAVRVCGSHSRASGTDLGDWGVNHTRGDVSDVCVAASRLSGCTWVCVDTALGKMRGEVWEYAFHVKRGLSTRGDRRFRP